MSELITVARPYATAVFNFAAECKSIEHWQTMLSFASEVACNRKMMKFLSSPLESKTLSLVFNAVCGDRLDEYAQNLIKIMAENGRLPILPYVLKMYMQLRNDYELITEVNIVSAISLSNFQLETIKVTFEKRLSCKIILNYKINKYIIAGIVIRIGNLVIDGSVRGRLDRLSHVLRS